MLAVSAAVFVLVSLSPIDPAQANAGQAAWLNMSEAKRAQLQSYWGSDTPIWQRYSNWLAAALQGDLGTSLRFNAPVTSVIAQRFARSAVLMLVSWLLSGVLGLVLGVAAGVRQGSWLDKAIKGYSYLLASTPTFWLGLLMLVVFAVWLGWFPLGFSMPIGISAADVTLGDLARHLFLPALTLSLAGVANIALHTREKTIDVMSSPYVLHARARGESLWQITRRHGLRNLLLPAVTLQLASIAEIFGGSVLVEQVFSYPGLGQAAVTAGLGSDVALLAAITMTAAALVGFGNLLANLLYTLIDPRMRPSHRRLKEAVVQRSGSIGNGEVFGGDSRGDDLPTEDSVEAYAETHAEAHAEAAAETPAEARVEAHAEACVEAHAKAPAEADVEAPAEAHAKASVEASVQAPIGTSFEAPATPTAQTVLHQASNTAGSNRLVTLTGFATAALLLAAIVIAGLALGDAATTTDLASKNLSPSLLHPLGSDWLGRDMLARTLAGLSTSAFVGLLAASSSALIALALACVCAFGGRRGDAVVSFVVDMVLGIPQIVLILLISFACGGGFVGVVVGVALSHWPNLTRVLRAEMLQLRSAPWLAQLKQLGVSRLRTIGSHILPYVLPQFLVGLVLLFPHAILHEAALTYLGFGLPPEQPAIGIILSESSRYLSAGDWWMAVFPGLALVVMVLLFDRVSANLRRLLDPRRNQD
jgi:peptide/nickel transport system permease protein